MKDKNNEKKEKTYLPQCCWSLWSQKPKAENSKYVETPHQITCAPGKIDATLAYQDFTEALGMSWQTKRKNGSKTGRQWSGGGEDCSSNRGVGWCGFAARKAVRRKWVFSIKLQSFTNHFLFWPRVVWSNNVCPKGYRSKIRSYFGSFGNLQNRLQCLHI